jgi:hypothetical protein
MLVELPYQRENTIAYAEKWALKRNPAYLDFEKMGGDCTSFASQCIFAGSRVMNFAPVLGWYYVNGGSRTASWSGVVYFYNFLVTNKGVGPYAEVVGREQIQPGDILQLGDGTGRFYHSPVIVGTTPEEIYVAAHSYDTYMRPLSSYEYAAIRFLHIQGIRQNR